MAKFEILAPAGDLEKLKVAILYGADAVFIGGKMFSLRSRASNFTLKDIKEGCDFAHAHNAKIHVTCNIVMHYSDTKGILEYLLKLEQCGVDCIITSSLYILSLVKEKTKMEAHISTQQSVANSNAVKLFESLKADRVVLARECSIKDIKEIKEKSNIAIEAFIHGGMCTSFSGRCMLSNIMTNRDANRGGCAHSCRWRYDVYTKDKKINEEGDFFAMSSKDLCSIDCFENLLKADVDSFKIEGRMKSLHYIASVVYTYKSMVKEYLEKGRIEDKERYYSILQKAENRPFSTGFLKGEVTVNEQLYDLNRSMPNQEFAAIVKSYDKESKKCIIETRNKFYPSEDFELFTPRGISKINLSNIFNLNDEKVDVCNHPGEELYFYTDIELMPYDIIR